MELELDFPDMKNRTEKHQYLNFRKLIEKDPKLRECADKGQHDIIYWFPPDNWTKSIVAYCRVCEYYHPLWGVSSPCTRFHPVGYDEHNNPIYELKEEHIDPRNSAMCCWNYYRSLDDPDPAKSFEDYIEIKFIIQQLRLEAIKYETIWRISYSTHGYRTMSPPHDY
jgi:hypothetical protein